MLKGTLLTAATGFLGTLLAISGCGRKDPATTNPQPSQEPSVPRTTGETPSAKKPANTVEPPTKKPANTDTKSPQEEALARFRVVNNLQLMALGIDNLTGYNNDRLPPADGGGLESPIANQPRQLIGLSWRVAALNYIGSDQNKPGQEKDIYAKFHDNKFTLTPGSPATDRWNVPELKALKLDPYSCPIPGKTVDPWLTYYRVFMGNGAAFEPNKQLTFKDFTDGKAKTMLIVEAGEAVPWPKPDELLYDPAKPLPKLGGMFPDGFYAVFADAQVRFIKNGTDEKLIRAWITRSGNEAITELPPLVDTEAMRKAAGYKD